MSSKSKKKRISSAVNSLVSLWIQFAQWEIQFDELQYQKKILINELKDIAMIEK